MSRLWSLHAAERTATQRVERAAAVAFVLVLKARRFAILHGRRRAS